MGYITYIHFDPIPSTVKANIDANTAIKGKVCRKVVCWKSSQVQAIHNADKFVSSLEQILIMVHQWILCSEWVPSEQKPKQLKTTVIHKYPHNPSQSIHLLWSEQSVFGV